MRWFVLRLFADHPFSPDYLVKAISRVVTSEAKEPKLRYELRDDARHEIPIAFDEQRLCLDRPPNIQ
jgi:hypothetical protein